MASALSPDGSALNPVTVFHHETDSKIIAVLTVSGLATGTKLSYVRYLDGKYVDSKSAQVTKPATYFYFYFTALPGKTLAVGQYRLKLYVNESSAREVSYQVQ